MISHFQRLIPKNAFVFHFSEFILWLLFFGTTAGCGHKNTPEAVGHFAHIVVGYQKVQEKDYKVTLQFTASIFPILQAEIRPKVSGWLTQVYVNTGDFVKAGQILAEMDHVQMEQAVREAQQSYRSSLSGYYASSANVEKQTSIVQNSLLNLNRSQELFAGGFIPKQQYDNAKTSYLSDKATLESLQAQTASAKAETLRAKASLHVAEANLADTFLRAPFSGVVVSRNLDPGSFLSTAVTTSSPPVATIADNRKLKVIVYVADKDIAQIHLGEKVEIFVDVFPGKIFPGEVTRIAGGLDPQSRTLSVEVDVKNPLGKLVPGMFSRVSILTAVHPHALVLPLEAIVRKGKKTSVWVVKNTPEGWKAEEIPVKLGEIQGSEVQIFQGLQAGEDVVTDGKEMIRPGAPIQAFPSVLKNSDS